MKRWFTILWIAVSLPLAAQARDIGITQWVTPYGVKVLFLAANEIPMIDLLVDVDAASRWDTREQSGLASMAQSMLARGIRAQGSLAAMSETEISEAFAELAVQRGGSVSLDRASITMRMLADADVRDRAVALLARVMAQPAFDAAILDREKKRTIAALEESLTQPQSLATRALWGMVYGDHPYGLEPTAQSIASITVDALTAFHQRYWQPPRMRVTIVGSLTESQAKEMVDRLFEHFERPPAAALAPKRQQPVAMQVQASSGRKAIAHPATQSHIWFGLQGISRDDADFFALTVGNYIFGGGGFVSRLTEEVREKRGLSYSVFSAFQPLAQPGPFMIGLQTQSAKAPEALEVVRNTLKRFLEEGPTEKELQAAKQNLVGGFALRVDTNRKLLDNLAQINYYDLPLDYLQTWTANIAAVSRDDIHRVMKRVVNPDRISVVVVAGPVGFTP